VRSPELQVDVRLLSATHKDLATEVQAGRFRQDLYYRLNVIQIRVPPLRERIGDLSDIATRVLERIAHDAGVSPAPRLTPSALAHLAAYGFPGNVRELENLLHRDRTAAGASLGLSLRQMRYRMARLGVQITDHGVVLGERFDPDVE
jgi:two-component system response regulator PilR (NtrC family)